MLKILFIEDNEKQYQTIHKLLLDVGLKFSALKTETEKTLLQALKKSNTDIVIAANLTNGLSTGLALKITQDQNKDLPFIFFSDGLDQKIVIELLAAGATDCLLKSDCFKLSFIIKKAVQCRAEKLKLRTIIKEFDEIENNYRILADSGQALIWTSGTDMKCNWFNSTWLQFTGRTMEQEIGDGWTELVHPEDFESCVNTYVEAFKKHENFSMFYRLKRRDKEYRWIQDNGSPRYGLDNEFKGYIGYCLDITETITANLSLKKALADKQILMRELYHRTNNNLQTILSILNMQSLRIKDPVIQALFQDTENRIISMALMHQQLYHKDDLSSIDINKYILELSDRLFQNFGAPSARISLSLPTRPLMTHIDVALPMGMLFNELLTNSLKHGFPGDRTGTITVCIEKSGENQIRFEYSDDGIGVPDSFDFHNQDTTGFSVIFGISESQLGSTVEIQQKNGLSWKFEFADNLFTKRV